MGSTQENNNRAGAAAAAAIDSWEFGTGRVSEQMEKRLCKDLGITLDKIPFFAINKIASLSTKTTKQIEDEYPELRKQVAEALNIKLDSFTFDAQGAQIDAIRAVSSKTAR